MAHDASKLPSDGFERVGEIRPENGQHCQRHGCQVDGPVIYALVVETVVMKIGTTGTGDATLYRRMRETAGEINKNIKLGTAKTEAFKNLAILPIMADKQIDVWAKRWPDVTTLLTEERRLTIEYDPPWTGSVKQD